MAIYYGNITYEGKKGVPLKVVPMDDKRFTLKELQTMVQGLIEFIYIADGQALVINEEGKFHHDWRENVEATKLAQGFLFEGDVIVGPAVWLTSFEARPDEDPTVSPATPSSVTGHPDTR